MKVVNYPLMPVVQLRDPSKVTVEFIDMAKDLPTLDAAITACDMIAVDTETHAGITLDDGIWAAVRVISIGTRTKDEQGEYSYRKFVVDVLDIPVERLAQSMALIKNAYAWNANFDQRVMSYLGTPIATWHDVMLDEQISWTGIDGRNWYLSLAVAAKRYLGYDMVGKGDTQTSFDGVSPLTKAQIEYAADDALLTLYLAEVINDRLEEQGLTRVSEIEQGARPFIAMMMEEGFPFKSKDWETVLIQKRTIALEALVQIAILTEGNSDASQTLKEVEAILNEATQDDAFAQKAREVVSSPSESPFETLARVQHVVEDAKVRTSPFVGPLNDALSKLGPNWNTNSEFQLRTALNRFDQQSVNARLGRDMGDADQVDKATMTELVAAGSTLAASILRYREAMKYVTTYGGDFLRYVRDGRIRSRYKQLLTSTGRLSSFEPNGQNLVGPTKEYIAPQDDRVLTAADYSQAELRVLATLAEEESMLDAFREGADLHEMTAKRILGIDISELKKTDPKEAKAVRTKCKRLNFGIPYGLGAAALARQLTNEGVPTSTQEAQDLLNGYDKQYPKVAKWLKECGSFIDDLSKNPGPIDWALSFKLLRVWQQAESKRKEFKRKNKRLPSSLELAHAIHPRSNQLGLFDEAGQWEQEVAELEADIEWAFAYDAPVVLRPGGEPLAWEIRTLTGRRRLFTVAMDSGFKRSETESGSSGSSSDKFDGLVTSAMLIAATTDKPSAGAMRDAWAVANKVALPSGVARNERQSGESMPAFKERSRKARSEERLRCVKAFEGNKRILKTAFVEHVCDQMGPQATEYLLNRALADQIRKSGNALRNYRIQAGVADIVGIAMTSLYALCQQYPDLKWVQSVHDSIVGECDAVNGATIATLQKKLMEDAMGAVYSGVPAKVDAEVCSSLGESGIIEHV